MGNNDEIEYRLKLLSKPFEDEGLSDVIVIKYLKNYIDNVNKIPQLSKVIANFQNERNQANQEEESLKLKALDEIESKEAKLIDELEERKIFNFDPIYSRLKLIKKDADERNIDEPEYNLSKLEKILLKLDDDRTKNPFDIDSRYENLDALILFLRNSEDKDILNSIFTKNQQRINCRKFVSINYLRYKKESEKLNQIKNQSGWGIWFEVNDLISKKYRNIIPTKELKSKINFLNNEFMMKIEFKDLDVLQNDQKLPIPKGVHFEQPKGSKYYILAGLGNKSLRFKNKEEDICVLFQFYYDNHGLFINNEEAYKSVKNPERKFVNMMTSLKGTIRRQGFDNFIKLEGTGMGTYRLKIIINN